MNWDELINDPAPPRVPRQYVCDCTTVLAPVTPTKEGLCPKCGYYAYLHPISGITRSELAKTKETYEVRLDGVETRGRKYNVTTAKKVVELYTQGLTMKQIAKDLSIGVSSVHKYIHDRRSLP